MIAALFFALLTAASPMPISRSVEVYTCEYLATDATSPHEPLRADLVVSHSISVAPAAEQWTVTWPNKAPLIAEQFVAQFGSVGGSTALRWDDTDGKKQTAFISYSSMRTADGSEAAWLGLGKPSLWQAPGYLCGTPPLHKLEGAK